MNKLETMTNTVKLFTKKHGPEILTGLGISGMIVSTVIAVRATPKALALMEERKNELNVDSLTPVETVKTTWKCYLPAVLLTTASAACLIGASSVSLKQNAILTTAYKLSEKTLREYKEAVRETLGEKKEQVIKEKVAENRLESDPVSTHDVIITGGGDTLCYDAIGGRYFKSSIDKIRKAENNLNRTLMRDEMVSLNELYSELGLEQTRSGDDLGWRFDGTLIELELTAKLAENSEPCIVIDYTIPPTYGYYRYG